MQELSGYENHRVGPRLNYFKPGRKKIAQSIAEEIISGLSAPSKSINPKFFYDDRGSELFEQICNVPEYYLTRTEAGILGRIGDELSSFLGGNTRLVELGSGSSAKTRLILDILDGAQPRTEYFPIDISDILRGSCRQLLDDYPNLHITGVIDTYHEGLRFIKNLDAAPSLVAFLGSSLGNFAIRDAGDFLRQISSSIKNSDFLLLGLDLVKDKNIIQKAYDDAQGVTERFNLNVLSRINKELLADFDTAKFSHVARFNEKEGRIEMYLRSDADQTVTIRGPNARISFARDELIHTEHSHKYTVPQIRDMLHDSGFKIDRIWQDEKKHYALVLCSKASRPART